MDLERIKRMRQEIERKLAEMKLLSAPVAVSETVTPSQPQKPEKA